MRKKGLWLGLMALLLLWPASLVFADGVGLAFDDGRFFVDEDVVLEPGETFDGDLGIFDGDLTVPQGSTVNGDVFVTNGDVGLAGRVNGNLVVINGDLTVAETGQVRGDAFGMSGDLEIAGRVKGDLSVMFGHLDLVSTAVVEGDLTVLSGSFERATGAQVLGEEMPEIPLPKISLIPDTPRLPEIPEIPEVPDWTPPSPVPLSEAHGASLGQQIGRFIGRIISTGFLSLLFVAVGLLIVFVWPRATHRVADCIAALPAQSFGLGLLTFLIAAMLEVVAAVLMILIILVAAALIATVILIPIGLLLILFSVLVLLPVPLVLTGAMVLGWVGLAQLIGQKVLRALGLSQVTPLGSVLAGLLVTVPLVGILWVLTPLCCAWPFVILLTSVGLGAVIHTRFGAQSCGQSDPSSQAEVLPIEAMDEEDGHPDVPLNRTP